MASTEKLVILRLMDNSNESLAPPRFCDAEQLADILAHREEFRRLRTTILQALGAQSCRADLAQAQTCCDALDGLLASPRRSGTLERRATESALLMQGVTLYVRATFTGSGKGERGGIKISHRLTDEQLQDHEALIEVRDRVVAHVRLNEKIADETWYHALVFFVETANGWRPGGATRSYQFHRETFERLKRLLPVASELIVTRFRERVDAIAHSLNGHGVPIEAIEASLFDPVERFGTAETVMSVLRGMPPGEVSL